MHCAPISRIPLAATVLFLFTAVALVTQAAPAAAVTPFVQTGTFEDSFDVDCGTFLLHDQITIDFRDTFFLDAAGNATRVQTQLNGTGTWSGNGITVRDRNHGIETFDLATGTKRTIGLVFNVTVPGHGSIAQDTGVLIENADGSVVIHGPHEVAAAGDDLAPLFCPAFA
jgi:hypothetical protein